MKRIIITLLICVLLITGCSITKVSDISIKSIFDTVLYVDNNLTNTYMDGYKLYLPHGVKIVDKSEHNFKLKDSDFYYYLYVDTIAYFYKTDNTYTENDGHFFSEKINHDGVNGYIDITENGDYYFIVLMYNYAKIESYVLKEDLNRCLINISYILSSIKYNDEIIKNNLVEKGSIFKEEEFDIFNANKEKDTFLTYEKEYGTYDKEIKPNDNDVLELEEDS